MRSKKNHSSSASRKRSKPISARRFFVAGYYKPGDTVEFDVGDAHKIATVLRLKTGDTVEVFDSTSAVFDASMVVKGATVAAVLGTLIGRAAKEASIEIAIAQGIPKGRKMDYVVEKATEIGVVRIIPLRSERVIGGAGEGKTERWRRLAKTAAQQCGRSTVPIIEEETEWETLLTQAQQYDRVIIPWEVREPKPLREILPDLIRAASRVLVIVGPEGGFSHEEVERAEAAGAVAISLGSRILRTETAALVIASAILYETGDL